MSSKYAHGPLGIGCIGSCGYITGQAGAFAQLDNQALRNQYNIVQQNLKQQFHQIQQQYNPTPVVNWTWNSTLSSNYNTIIQGTSLTGQWTYLSYYSYHAWLKYQSYGTSNLSVNNIALIIQQKFTNPTDVFIKYNSIPVDIVYGNNADGSPPVVSELDKYFWLWFLSYGLGIVDSIKDQNTCSKVQGKWDYVNNVCYFSSK